MDAREERNADGVEMREQARASESEKQAESGAEEREDEAFGEHLANEAGFAGTESGADGDFFLARGGTGEEEVRKIGTDNKHDDADGAGENEKSGAKASADVCGEEREAGDKIIALGMLAGDLFAEDGGFGLRGLDGGAGIQAADDGESVAPTVGFFTERKGRVKIDAASGSEDGAEVERGGENADYGDGGVIESERTANDGGIGGEAALPKSVAEEDGFGAVPLALFGCEEAAELRLDAEKREEILGDGDSGEPLGLAGAGEAAVADTVEGEVSGHVGERFILSAKIQEMVHLKGLAGEANLAVITMVGNPNEAGGIAEWQRTDEESVDDAEDGATGADAKADDENGESGEAKVAAESAEGVFEVAGEGV